MRALAIAGPRATKRQVGLFRDARVESQVLESSTEEEARHAVKDHRPDVVLIFGGDGTVNRHLAQVAKTNLPVLAVPAGSGNDLARAAGMLTIDDALDTWQRFIAGTANIQAVDLGRVTSVTLADARYFSCCANIGLDADAARRTDSLPDWLKSRGGYFLGGLMALANYRPEPMNIASGGRRSSEPGWFVSISNTPTFGGGLKIAPQASIVDGQLDVTYVSATKFSRFQLAGHFPKIFSGRHVGLPEIELFKSANLEIETAAPQPVYADGEYITETSCKIEIAPGALRLVTAHVL
jgi:diacylglycerol kinase (ATP)